MKIHTASKNRGVLWLLLIFCTGSHFHAQQSGTEVFVYDLNDDWELRNGVNISVNPGAYNNQPFWVNNDTLLFASERNGQTDIRMAVLSENKKYWLSNTSGSEYSPRAIPGEKYLSAVRLDKDSTQLLYRYSFEKSVSSPVLPELKVGYYCWIKPDLLVSFVVDEPVYLAQSLVNENNSKVIMDNVGRSIHQVPGTKEIAFINKQVEPWEIWTYHYETGKMRTVTKALPVSEDFCFSPDGTLIMASKSQLYRYEEDKEAVWIPMSMFSDLPISGSISRISVSPNAKKLALVVNE